MGTTQSARAHTHAALASQPPTTHTHRTAVTSHWPSPSHNTNSSNHLRSFLQLHVLVVEAREERLTCDTVLRHQQHSRVHPRLSSPCTGGHAHAKALDSPASHVAVARSVSPPSRLGSDFTRMSFSTTTALGKRSELRSPMSPVYSADISLLTDTHAPRKMKTHHTHRTHHIHLHQTRNRYSHIPPCFGRCLCIATKPPLLPPRTVRWPSELHCSCLPPPSTASRTTGCRRRRLRPCPTKPNTSPRYTSAASDQSTRTDPARQADGQPHIWFRVKRSSVSAMRSSRRPSKAPRRMWPSRVMHSGQLTLGR